MSLLDELLDSTNTRLEETKLKISQELLEQRLASVEKPRGFAQALAGNIVAIIAEIKRASPLRGELDPDLKASELARSYAEGGAAALSVLTEPAHFQGSLEDLEAARDAGLPVLRKDFVIDEFQVLESRAWGADALLLIARVLNDESLRDLMGAVTALGMDALVEVHDERDLERALAAGCALIGVNHRDLATFDLDPERTAKLAPLVPSDVTLVSLSGVASRAEIEDLKECGAHAVLIGSSLVTSADPRAKLRDLVGVRR
jgi:indole-3-glycerol phosphate synthase